MTRVIALPVSGRQVLLASLTGAEELLLLEAPGDELALALTLIARLAHPTGVESSESRPDDWLDLTATDLDFFILRLRQFVLGDRIISDVCCSVSACGARIDISFDIDKYLSHYLPAHNSMRGRGWIAESADEPGWFRLRDSRTRAVPDVNAVPTVFRLPTIADLRDVAARHDAPAELSRRCIRNAADSPRRRQIAESAMQAMAPNLSRELQGQCPECRASVDIHFDPRRYCLQELRDRARFLYQDIDVLARRYHWSESDILALPLVRRMQYADAARVAMAGPA